MAPTRGLTPAITGPGRKTYVYFARDAVAVAVWDDDRARVPVQWLTYERWRNPIVMIVCLHSGGIDSTTMLYSLRATGVNVISLAIDYGQRHVRELEAARATAEHLGVPHERLVIPTLQPVKPPVPDGHYADPSMKQTVAPNRNMVFLALAAAIAVDRQAGAIAYAAHAGDHPIYPDCRPEFIEVMQRAIHLGNYHQVDLIAPFKTYTKADIVAKGAALKVPWELTWSCYRGLTNHCGTCGTCNERREAFQLAAVDDPTHYSPGGA